MAKTYRSHTEDTIDTKPHHGSRRGAAAMVGAVIGFILGALAFETTEIIAWLIVLPAVGIVLGLTLGRELFSRE